jgi:hypothetical protein
MESTGTMATRTHPNAAEAADDDRLRWRGDAERRLIL